ncbi:MAG: hypothetical protein HOP95_10020 [Sphingomonas sp.]|nr:hypothetical protein [Sphingomonas sp.]
MSIISIGTALTAPARSNGYFPVSPTILVIILVVAIVGALAVLGLRMINRPPGSDTKAERERIDD